MNRRQVGFVDMRQDHVLLVADAQLVMAVAFGEIGQRAHLIRGRVARGLTPWAFRLTCTMA